MAYFLSLGKNLDLEKAKKMAEKVKSLSFSKQLASFPLIHMPWDSVAIERL